MKRHEWQIEEEFATEGYNMPQHNDKTPVYFMVFIRLFIHAISMLLLLLLIVKSNSWWAYITIPVACFLLFGFFIDFLRNMSILVNKALSDVSDWMERDIE